MKKLGMGALVGVGQGSARPPRLVVMDYRGHPRGKEKAPVAFVGKGVTFGTGGTSLKPAQGMEEMKWDLAGAGRCVRLVRTRAGRQPGSRARAGRWRSGSGACHWARRMTVRSTAMPRI